MSNDLGRVKITGIAKDRATLVNDEGGNVWKKKRTSVSKRQETEGKCYVSRGRETRRDEGVVSKQVSAHRRTVLRPPPSGGVELFTSLAYHHHQRTTMGRKGFSSHRGE